MMQNVSRARGGENKRESGLDLIGIELAAGKEMVHVSLLSPADEHPGAPYRLCRMVWQRWQIVAGGSGASVAAGSFSVNDLKPWLGG